MKFANLTEDTLRFSMSGVRYEVAPGDEVEIPDAFAYAVKGFGLPLVPSADVTPTAKAKTPEPKAEPAKEDAKPVADLASGDDMRPAKKQR